MKKINRASVIKGIVAAVLLLALVFVIAYQNRDRVIGGEIINIMDASGAKKESRSIEGYAGGTALPFGKKALLVTTNTLMLMDENGSGKAADISVPSPEADANGDYILVYDKDGRDFMLYSETKPVYTGRSEAAIIAGRVNQNGYALIACEVMSGGTEIMVYNSKGEAIYVWKLNSGEFVDMDLCADNSRMVISSVSNDENELRGELSIVRLDSGELFASGFQTDEIYFNVKINRDYTVTALGSERLALYNADGSQRWELSYNGRTLLGADISSADMTILCYENDSSGIMGNTTLIEVVNRLGEVTASTELDGLCEKLSKNGSMFAVAAGKRVYIYDEKCRLQKELLSDFSVKGLALFKSGSAAFVLGAGAGNILK